MNYLSKIKWVPATVIAQTGPVTYTIQIAGGVWPHHVDRLLRTLLTFLYHYQLGTEQNLTQLFPVQRHHQRLKQLCLHPVPHSQKLVFQWLSVIQNVRDDHHYV